ncbi:type I secretion system permease/ATPase [Rhodobacterales bacterium HKCCSP123]|nr:type I secretion system permease/ATPase [Rhodobacterales bacterium HKCCSP123]
MNGEATKYIGIRGLVSSVFILSVITNILMFSGPVFMLQIYDRVLTARSEETLVVLIILVAMLYGFFWIIDYSRSRILARVGARIENNHSQKFFSSYLYTVSRGRERPQANLQDLMSIRRAFSSQVVLSLFDLPWAPLFILAIYVFHPVLGYAALSSIILLAVVAIINQILTSKKRSRSATLSRDSERLLHEAAHNADYLWAQGMAKALTDRWRKVNDEALNSAVVSNDLSGVFSSFSKAARLLLQSIILGIGAWLVLRNEMTPGAMIAGSIMLGRALSPIEQTISQWETIQRFRQGLRSINELEADSPSSKEDPSKIPAPTPHLAVRSLTIKFPSREEPHLNQITFDVQSGEALGVVGPSASGKTTLARALVGLIPPSLGEVRIGNATLNQYDPIRRGNFIGYLPQEPKLFSASISENIARMESSFDIDDVVGAAKLASVHEDILRLPDGYDTLLGESGFHLSGGQKQRIALARALYRDPIFLILDEPNSALDSDGAANLNKVIIELKRRGRAIVVMTHRPSALGPCDRLLVLKGGRAIAYGDRDDIIEKTMKNSKNVRMAM